MKTTICFILVFALASNSVYSKNFNVKKTYQRPPLPFGNINHKPRLSSSSSNDRDSEIVRNDMQMRGDGSYQFDFETTNGIKRTEKGSTDGTMQGSSSHISPEGIEVKTTYVADETGYHPTGDHIPQIPDYILRAIEYIRTHPYIEKDYYTGQVKQNSISYKKPLTKATPKYNAFGKNNKKINQYSKNRFLH